mmetsp:Transcript_148845/g.378671  ORF Transcript_148845/g.378671 Transcript_148845/m.378671 type:complete len:204 (+) Transcript_148845:389-1000(+)
MSSPSKLLSRCRSGARESKGVPRSVSSSMTSTRQSLPEARLPTSWPPWLVEVPPARDQPSKRHRHTSQRSKKRSIGTASSSKSFAAASSEHSSSSSSSASSWASGSSSRRGSEGEPPAPPTGRSRGDDRGDDKPGIAGDEVGLCRTEPRRCSHRMGPCWRVISSARHNNRQSVPADHSKLEPPPGVPAPNNAVKVHHAQRCAG